MFIGRTFQVAQWKNQTQPHLVNFKGIGFSERSNLFFLATSGSKTIRELGVQSGDAFKICKNKSVESITRVSKDEHSVALPKKIHKVHRKKSEREYVCRLVGLEAFHRLLFVVKIL